ncbi:MAG TPA: tetratricopeptide repeat protein [Gemmatimonadaceae bacterium]|nr:tetratricopeptide repeat protein [Gemmatimonadaceae bacterium]
MATPFLSSEEYDERAHQLYNEGQFDEALDVLREGLTLYPNSVELHVGVGYAQLAREEYAWARHSFEQALVLEPEHEDGLAGLGETLLKLGQDEAALRCFRRTLELGYADDTDLMLQVGRSLFREGSIRERAELFQEAKEFFQTAAQQVPDSAEAMACIGYAQHRMGDDDAAIGSLRRALQLDGDHAEARIYLANILYDQSEFEAALYHFERTNPDDHWDELGIWRLIELKRSLYRLEENDPELKPWDDRLAELAGDLDEIDTMLMDLEPRSGADTAPAAETARGQLELFGSLLSSLVQERQDEDVTPEHQIIVSDGTEFQGSWEEIVRRMRDEKGNPSHSMQEFMNGMSQHGFRQTGVRIPTHDAESFVRGSAVAGLLRIVR